MKIEIIKTPLLIGIIALFAIYGYSTTPSGSPSIRSIEWTISHGLIGLSIVMNLILLRLFYSKKPTTWRAVWGRIAAFLVLAVTSVGLVDVLYVSSAQIRIGGEYGSNLFSGDSGFAIFLVIGWSAAWTLAILITYSVMQIRASKIKP